jgi:hypothetical protein
MIRGLQGITARGLFFIATITGTIGSAAVADEPIVKAKFVVMKSPRVNRRPRLAVG